MEYENRCESEEEARQRADKVTRPGITQQEVMDTYKHWAKHYDKDMKLLGHNGPKFGTEMVSETLGDFKHARILDAACGTGLGGKMLMEAGFSHVDGLDGSREMLDVAKENGAYKHYIEALLNQSRLPIDADTYDMVVTEGSFVPGHLSEDCFEEVARITKPGGFFAMVFCELNFIEIPDYTKNIEPRMAKLQEAGVWERIRRDVKPNYIHGDPGVVYVFRLQKDKNTALESLKS